MTNIAYICASVLDLNLNYIARYISASVLDLNLNYIARYICASVLDLNLNYIACRVAEISNVASSIILPGPMWL